MKKSPKIRVKTTPTRLVVLIAFAIVAFVGMAMQSCNVTRRITTESSYFQKGDTTTTIVTKTTETYDATKH